MRIAYLMTSLGMGGAERQVIAIAERMAQRGHFVLLVVLRERQKEQWPTQLDVVYLGVRKSPFRISAGLLRARRALIAFNPNLVHSHTFPANMFARVLCLFGCAPDVLSTIHNVYEGGRLRMLAYRCTDPLSIQSTAVSGAATARFVELKAVPAEKCIILSNGIDVSEFAPNAVRRAEVRLAQKAGDHFIWLAVGRVVPAKGFPNLLRAFALVRAANPNARLWIAGELPAKGARSPVNGLPDEIKEVECVRWLGLRRDMPALLDAADAFVLASAWEGMPLVVGEAMAMEKPVVATDVGGVREMVGDCGTLVPAQDSEALAGAMLSAMCVSQEDRRAQGSAARARILKDFSMDAKADEWEVLYRSLIARCGR